LGIPGLDRNTTMLTMASRSSQTEALTDTTAENGLPSVGHYIRKALIASDNDAYNRLYEFLGQEYFNETMLKKGYATFRAAHRLGVPLPFEVNRHTNPIRFVNGNTVIYEQAAIFDPKEYRADQPVPRGKGYIRDGATIEEPMEF